MSASRNLQRTWSFKAKTFLNLLLANHCKNVKITLSYIVHLKMSKKTPFLCWIFEHKI